MSAFFGLFIFIGVFNSFNARTSRINIFANLFRNRVFLCVIVFIVIVQVILIYFGGNLFRTVGLNFKEFNFMLVLSASVIPFDFVRKYFLKRKGFNYGVQLFFNFCLVIFGLFSHYSYDKIIYV